MIKQVLIYPDKKLREVSYSLTLEEVKSQEIKELIEDMKETLFCHNAHGLAAPQVGVHKRLFIIRTHPTKEDVQVFINPRVEGVGDKVKFKEGCLSFPGVEEFVSRFEEVDGEALNEYGEPWSFSCDGLTSIAIQHENDHLDGVLFIDHVSNLKKRYMLKDLEKFKKKYNVQRVRGSEYV